MDNQFGTIFANLLLSYFFLLTRYLKIQFCKLIMKIKQHYKKNVKKRFEKLNKISILTY